MSSAIPTWVRFGLVALGLPNAATGLWAVLAPEHWFERFPGWDPRLAAAEDLQSAGTLLFTLVAAAGLRVGAGRSPASPGDAPQRQAVPA